MNDYVVENFTKGTITRIEDDSLPKGASSGSLNWLTKGDRIELRRGQSVIGDAQSGIGRISGLAVSALFDKTQVILRSRGRKIESYNVVNDQWDESTVIDILPEEADGEDIAFSEYHSIAGAMVHASSPNSSAYKIMLANPQDVLDQGSPTHRGKISIKNGRTFLWDRKDTNNGRDQTGLYGSWIDKDELSDYTEVLAESVGTGDGTTTTFTGTLTMQKTNKTVTANDTTDVFDSVAHGFSNGDKIKFSTTGTLPAGIDAGRVYFVVNKNNDDFQISDIPNGPAIDLTSVGTGTHTATKGIERSVLYVRINDSAEKFQDDRNGNLVGSKGGSGTINYATGAFSVTFNTAPANAQGITSDYYWEDATDEGIWDFGKATPRVAGEGFVLRQDDGGAAFQNIATFNDQEYCMHVRKTWGLSISDDDSAAAQKIYRDGVGIPYWRAMVETGDGIYYVDDTDQINPFIRQLSYAYNNDKVQPRSISDNIDLSPYSFDQAAMWEWGEYIVVACRSKDSTINNIMLMYNTLFKAWDITDYRASVIGDYNGYLIAGDSGSNNVFKLFDWFTDEDSLIPNYWDSGETDLDYRGVKRCKRFEIRGLISRDQSFKIRISLDGGSFVEVGEIQGNGPYVDFGTQVMIGSSMVGTAKIGGGGTQVDEVSVSPYARELKINTDKFEKVIVQFEALGVGYVSVSEYVFKDLRYKGRKMPVKYRI